MKTENEKQIWRKSIFNHYTEQEFDDAKSYWLKWLHMTIQKLYAGLEETE